MPIKSLVFAGIAPHPPIMVPEIGKDEIVNVRSSIEAMRVFTERLVASGAESIVIISPHAPLRPASFFAYSDSVLHGDFANFNAAETTVEVTLDFEILDAIDREAAIEGLIVSRSHGLDADHGTAVPLYFLGRNGWNGRVVALGYSYLSNEDHLRFGRCIARAIESGGRPTALVASGDLSHRLKPGAPAGFDPSAYLFDEGVVDSIRSGQPARIVSIDQELRRMAGECGYRSMLVAIGASEECSPICDVISYEAPYGVGYLVAQLS